MSELGPPSAHLRYVDPVNGLVSVGYQGRDVQELARELTEAQVTVVVDIRLTPLSRKRGFSKNALSVILAEHGIRYIHLRALGNPKDNREPFHSGRVAEGVRRFRQLLTTDAAREALQELGRIASVERVAVLCFEANVDECHRQVVLEQAAQLHPHLATAYV